MCQQFRFDNKSQFRVFLAKPQKAADLKLEYMVALDADCRAVVRMPLACQSWERGRYEPLAKHGYSPSLPGGWNGAR